MLFRSLPEVVRKRVPTAGFFEGQTDEGELGMPYRQIDRVLVGLEQLRSEEEIAGITGFPIDKVRSIAKRVLQFRHKRRMPPVPKVRLRTIGLDWRE